MFLSSVQIAACRKRMDAMLDETKRINAMIEVLEGQTVVRRVCVCVCFGDSIHAVR